MSQEHGVPIILNPFLPADLYVSLYYLDESISS